MGAVCESENENVKTSWLAEREPSAPDRKLFNDSRRFLLCLETKPLAHTSVACSLSLAALPVRFATLQLRLLIRRNWCQGDMAQTSNKYPIRCEVSEDRRIGHLEINTFELRKTRAMRIDTADVVATDRDGAGTTNKNNIAVG